MELKYHEVINYFIKRYNLKFYLELGVRARETFDHVAAQEKIGIDIVPIPGIIQMTSDQYFETVGQDRRIDLAFIDAEHSYAASSRDYHNCLSRLSKKGVIILDDIAVLNSQGDGEWLLDPYYCGDAYKTFIDISNDPNVICHHIRGTRFGFVRKGRQVPHNIQGERNYEFMQKYHDEVFRPINWSDIDQILDNEDTKWKES